MFQLVIIFSPLTRVKRVQVNVEFFIHSFMVDKGQSQKDWLYD